MTGLLGAVNGGRTNFEKLSDPISLRQRVNELLTIRCARFDGYGFYAATSHAERLIGAAMVLDPSIRADGIGDTVIVGVNIASGTQIARAATRLRESGNDGLLVGVVLNALTDEWHLDPEQWTIPEVDVLLVLKDGELSKSGELAQRGHRGVSLAFR